MPHRLTIALPACLLLLTAALPLAAQVEDDGLYFPPKLYCDPDSRRRPPIPQLSILRTEKEGTPTYLLPIVFFDGPGDYSIPDRYPRFNSTSETHDFNDTSARYLGMENIYSTENVTRYRRILDVIGYRMSRRPETELQLEGGYSTQEGEDSLIAVKRAEEVRDYLSRIWEIHHDRIAILPSRLMCDSNDHAYRQDEARCVRFVTDDWSLFDRVVTRFAVVAVHPVSFPLGLAPNMSASEITEIDIIATVGDSIIAELTLPGEIAADRITLYTEFAVPDTLAFGLVGEEIHLQAIVHTRRGMQRASNRLALPVVEDIYHVQGWSARTSYMSLLPGFSHGDDSLSSYQRYLLDRDVDSLARLFPPGLPGDSTTVSLIYEAEMSETPWITPAEIDVRRNGPKGWDGRLLQRQNARLHVQELRNGLSLTSNEPEWPPGIGAVSYASSYEMLTLEQATMLDSIVDGRAEAVAACMPSHLRTEVQPYRKQEVPARYPRYFVAWADTPEERYYTRKVLLMVWKPEIDGAGRAGR